ncbi:MAG: PAS domain-containing protein, partial [Desulfobacterales bacterium]|nr:PAS domain-containing protein [Desulfobacterales bacterium]
MKVKPVRPRTRWLSLVFVAGFLSVLGISLFAVGFDTKQNKGHDTIKTRLGDIAMEAAKLTGDAHHGEIHLFLYLLYQNEEDRSEVRDWISSLYRRLDRLERLVEDPSLKEILDSVRESAGLLPDIAAGLSDPPDKASGEAAGDAAVGADGFDFAGRVPEVHHAHEVFSAIRDSGTRLSEAALEREAYEQSIAAEKAERRKQQFYMLIAVVFGIVLVLGVLWILAYASLIRETHQRKAAESARATEGEKYKTLFNNMTVGVFYQQADGVLSDVNQAALDMFEVTRPEFIGRFFSDHDWRIVGEDGSECRPSQYPPQVALSTGKAVTDVVLGIQKPGDGEIKWVSITAVPQYRQGEKNPRQAFVTMLDITPRKAFEGALKDSEQKVQHLHDQTEQLSLAAAEMISIPDKERVFQKISDAIVAYSDYQRVIISLFKDTFPYREIVGFAGIEAEKVERIRNIEFKRDWYDKVFEQGIRIGDFSYYIPHTMKHILYQEATYFGEGPVPEHSNVWHPEDNLFVRMNDDQGDFIGVISVDDSKSGEIPSGKTIRPLEIFSSLISQIILFKREQEMRENAEAQLQQAMKMESIGTLAGGIAHDFNNILGIIIGNTELNLEDMPEGDPLRGSLEEILDASLRAADIVRQLLSFSRKSDHLLAPVDIIPVIRDTLNFMRSSIPSTVRITHMIRTKTAVANADPIQINRILMNLCINAYQARPEKRGKRE